MAYVGAVPWHGLGQSLTPGQPIEVWLREAGMDYTVLRSAVCYSVEEDDQRVFDDRFVLFRSDNQAPLGVVSDRYPIVQPGQVLEFFRDLCDEHGFALETAGTLFGGARYWALAKTPMSLSLKGDEVNGYVLLATSADGSLATTAKVVSTRVVCNNTLGVAMNEKSKHAITVRHSTQFDATQVKIDMGLLGENWRQFAGKCERLAGTRLSRKDALKVLIDAMGDPEKPVDEQPNARPMASILDLFDGKAIGAEMPAVNGTGWGLVNAATQYYDHLAGRSDNSRLASAWFGPAMTTKLAVFESALARAIDATPAPVPTGLLDHVLDATVLA